jgi:hypothetical protein
VLASSVLAVPMVTGRPVSQAAATLRAAGLRISERPEAAGASSAATVTPSRLVSVPEYAATIRIPLAWQPTGGLGPAVGYNGTTGWVELRAVTEPAGLRQACAAAAAQNVSQYGRDPVVSDRRIDGRPGCQIVPALPGDGAVPAMISALVEYRSPLSDGANFLLISADLSFLPGIIDNL